jgi:hypothetical protein
MRLAKVSEETLKKALGSQTVMKALIECIRINFISRFFSSVDESAIVEDENDSHIICIECGELTLYSNKSPCPLCAYVCLSDKCLEKIIRLSAEETISSCSDNEDDEEEEEIDLKEMDDE